VAKFRANIETRFINPDFNNSTSSRLNSIKYKEDAKEYVREFKDLLGPLPKRCLNDNIWSFMGNLPTHIKKEMWSSKASFSSVEGLENAKICYECFISMSQIQSVNTVINEQKKYCDFCKKSGHTRDKCFKLKKRT
jgi:hypothetical protein